jgi:hypothetical protein
MSRREYLERLLRIDCIINSPRIGFLDEENCDFTIWCQGEGRFSDAFNCTNLMSSFTKHMVSVYLPVP